MVDYYVGVVVVGPFVYFLGIVRVEVYVVFEPVVAFDECAAAGYEGPGDV